MLKSEEFLYFNHTPHWKPYISFVFGRCNPIASLIVYLFANSVLLNIFNVVLNIFFKSSKYNPFGSAIGGKNSYENSKFLRVSLVQHMKRTSFATFASFS